MVFFIFFFFLTFLKLSGSQLQWSVEKKALERSNSVDFSEDSYVDSFGNVLFVQVGDRVYDFEASNGNFFFRKKLNLLWFLWDQLVLVLLCILLFFSKLKFHVFFVFFFYFLKFSRQKKNGEWKIKNKFIVQCCLFSLLVYMFLVAIFNFQFFFFKKNVIAKEKDQWLEALSAAIRYAQRVERRTPLHRYRSEKIWPVRVLLVVSEKKRSGERTIVVCSLIWMDVQGFCNFFFWIFRLTMLKFELLLIPITLRIKSKKNYLKLQTIVDY